MAGLASVGFFAVALPLIVSLLAMEPFQLSDRYLADYTALMNKISEEERDKATASIGSVEVYRTASFKVPLLSFNASNTGAEALKAKDLAYMDLLIIYDFKTGGTDQDPILEKRTMWVKYDAGCASSATCWRLNQTYNDVIDPVDTGNSTGALSKGEMVKITIRFADQDQPYFNSALGKGAFFLYLNPKDGDSGAKAVTDPKEVQI